MNSQKHLIINCHLVYVNPDTKIQEKVYKVMDFFNVFAEKY